MRIVCKNNIILVASFFVFLSACIHRSSLTSSNYLKEIKTPIGFPEVNFPEDNKFTKDRWILGKKLFYDKALSLDSSISCSSCHQAALAFSDSLPLSLGVKKLNGTQNAPTLTNVAYNPYFTRLGGVSTLEKQILVPIQEHNEFNFNIIEIAKRLQARKEYLQLSKKAYNRELDYYVITRAIANFERSLISGNSKYDRFKQRLVKLTESEEKGMNLFYSNKTNCSKCHEGFNFTNYNFENNGLYEKYKDIGRKRLTSKDEDLEKFKVPTLRNIEVTAPYMHDGSIKNLTELVSHYNGGGKTNKQKSDLIKPLNLTEKEQQYLIDFLKTLTDKNFCNNKLFKNS